MKKAKVRVVPSVAEKREQVYQLWDAMTDFSASEIDEALLFLMRRLMCLVDADGIRWAGGARVANGAQARRDPMCGWRAVKVRLFSPNTKEEASLTRAIREQDDNPAMVAVALAQEAGTRLRVRRLHDGFLDIKAFEKSDHYRYMHQAFNFRDCLYTATPIKQDAESYFLFHRIGRDDRFTKADVEIMTFAMRGLKWFQKELLLANGITIANEPLSPVERRIVRHLLTDKTEREIADAMNQKLNTTHSYVKNILRKYGVRGRTGFMALWLARK